MRIGGRKALPGGRSRRSTQPRQRPDSPQSSQPLTASESLQSSQSGAFLPFSQIKVGEPDANAEYFAGRRARHRPIFLDCFLTIPNFPTSEFKTGEKYLIYGQKGTGKTAALRYLATQAESFANTEFLIFKKTFLEEIDIHEFAKLPLMLDEEAIKQFKHYHHTVKRLLTLIILNKAWTRAANADIETSEIDNDAKSLIKRISESSVADVIRFGMDSVKSIVQSTGFDIGKATAQKILVEGGRLLKRNNDDLLTYLVRYLNKTRRSIRLYLDEIHFAYRSEESLQQDAILVRDTILAVQALNERFTEEGLDVVIYLAVRAEYLEHPLIATADINHTIESVGFELTWSNYPPSKEHPLFDLIVLRFKASIGPLFERRDFFNSYLANIDPVEFVERTWSKPRDFIRFFKCASKLYPNKTSLSPSEANAVWRNYAQEAWKEMKSAASPFLSPEAITVFEHVLAKLTPNIYDGSLKLDVRSFAGYIMPVYIKTKGNNANFYGFEHFLHLLYILGIFLTRRRDEHDQDIFHSYHRGNRNYHANGEVRIHPTVLKAFG